MFVQNKTLQNVINDWMLFGDSLGGIKEKWNY